MLWKALNSRSYRDILFLHVKFIINIYHVGIIIKLQPRLHLYVKIYYWGFKFHQIVQIYQNGTDPSLWDDAPLPLRIPGFHHKTTPEKTYLIVGLRTSTA